MRIRETLATTVSKQRLRVEIGNHIQDFLQKGGKIEELAGHVELNSHSRLGRWPAATGMLSPPNMDAN